MLASASSRPTTAFMPPVSCTTCMFASGDRDRACSRSCTRFVPAVRCLFLKQTPRGCPWASSTALSGRAAAAIELARRFHLLDLEMLALSIEGASLVAEGEAAVGGGRGGAEAPFVVLLSTESLHTYYTGPAGWQ